MPEQILEQLAENASSEALPVTPAAVEVEMLPKAEAENLLTALKA